jgi:hypothetical protein
MSATTRVKMYWPTSALDDFADDFEEVCIGFEDDQAAAQLKNMIIRQNTRVKEAKEQLRSLITIQSTLIIWSMRSPGSSSSRFDRVSITPEIPLFDRSPADERRIYGTWWNVSLAPLSLCEDVRSRPCIGLA